MKALALLALLPFHAHAADFQPHCYCAPIANAGRYVLCVEKNVEPRGQAYDCEAAFYSSQTKCEQSLDNLIDTGRCDRI